MLAVSLSLFLSDIWQKYELTMTESIEMRNYSNVEEFPNVMQMVEHLFLKSFLKLLLYFYRFPLFGMV